MAINDPRDIPGLVAWYSAEAQAQADGSNVTQLTDFSGNGKHALAQTGDYAVYRTAGGAGDGPRFSFPTASAYYGLSGVNLGDVSSEYMASLKAAFNSGAANGGFVLTDGGNSRYPSGDGTVWACYCRPVANIGLPTPTMSIDVWRRLNEWSAANDHVLRLDEVVQNNVTTGAFVPTTTLQFFRDSGGFEWEGDFGGAAFYNRKLTTAERNDLDDYFAANPSGGVPVTFSINDPRDIPKVKIWFSAKHCAQFVADGASITIPVVNLINPGTYDASRREISSGVFETVTMRHTGGPGGGAWFDTGVGSLSFLHPFHSGAGWTGSEAGESWTVDKHPAGAAGWHSFGGDSQNNHFTYDNAWYCGAFSNTRFYMGVVGAGTGTFKKVRVSAKLGNQLYKGWVGAWSGAQINALTTLSAAYNSTSLFTLGRSQSDAWRSPGFSLAMFVVGDLSINEQSALANWADANLDGGLPFNPEPDPPINLAVDPHDVTADFTWDPPITGLTPEGYEVRFPAGEEEPPPPEDPIGYELTGTFIGACPDGSNPSLVISKHGAGASVRTFTGEMSTSPSATWFIPSRPAGVAHLHHSWKPYSLAQITDANVIAITANMVHGDFATIWHESDVKYRQGRIGHGLSTALATLNYRISMMNKFHEIVKRLREAGTIPWIFTVNVWAGWSVDNSNGINPSSPSLHADADYLGLDMDGLPADDDFYDFVTRQLKSSKLATAMTVGGYIGVCAPEFCMPSVDSDPDRSERIAWFHDQVADLKLGYPTNNIPPLATINWFDTNGVVGPAEKLSTPTEIAEWREEIDAADGSVDPIEAEGGGGGGGGGATPVDVGNTFEYEITGLTILTEYEVEARSYLDGLYSDWASITFTTEDIPPPDPPDETTLEVTTASTTAQMTWTHVPTATGYRVRVDGGSATDVGLALANLVTGLTPETEYLFEVQAYNDSGSSDWTSVLATTTETPDILSTGFVKVWTGSEWKQCPVRVWNGSEWEAKPVKIWDGAEWVLA